MGKLVWHEYARFTALTASIYAVWAGFWGLFYRKFFWDFIGGILRNPGGLQPSPKFAVFIMLIVKFPIIQSVAILLGFWIIALEFPFLPLGSSRIYRSLALRIVLLVFQVALNILYYQGTNAAIWSLIAAVCYARAVALGEKMAQEKENRAKDGGV
ncbi:hypothetical protein M378DRAFT_445342 [Amanita muscaria Koide BX008]|uniref:DUF7727 domain-containing protein n=1 Tax=Amanita muscaria (strain Koide BX008) TaxID=946122 RepID=A0A0C2WVV2_AMAMK|nr:hypothetical protein M378DRAFT_445342 [Amanita muscaria Koide BX008]